MDFHTFSRRDLQTLCKKNRIPANTTNVTMADALQALQSAEGLVEIQESTMLQTPKTNQKSTVTKPKKEDQASPLPRSRQTSARLSGINDKEKKEVSETPCVVNTKRRVSKKEESNGILGTAVGRRTRQTVRKEVGSEMVRTEVRRSTRLRGIKMSPLSNEEVKSEKHEIEAIDKSDEKAEQSDDVIVDVQLESEEEKIVEAEIVVLQSKEDHDVDVKELEEKKVEVQEEQKEGEVIANAIYPIEEITVANKKEEAIIESQMSIMENIVNYVEEKLVENKGEDVMAVYEEAEQGETVEFKSEQMGVKVMIGETSVDTKDNGKDENLIVKVVDPLVGRTVENKQEDVAIAKEKNVTVIENIVDNAKEMLLENKEEDDAVHEEAKPEDTIDFKSEKLSSKSLIEEMSILADTKHEDGVSSIEEMVEEHTLVNDDSPIKGLITSYGVTMNQELNFKKTEEVVKKASSDEVVVGNEEFSILEFSVKTETSVSQNEIVELGENDLNFKLTSEPNNNKENAGFVSVKLKAKSNVVNYENLSLRKLKSAYKEMVAKKSVGEEKRTALKAVHENGI